MRPSKRAYDEMRHVSLDAGVARHAEGSCLVKFGDTHVLVTATLEERLPPCFGERPAATRVVSARVWPFPAANSGQG